MFNVIILREGSSLQGTPGTLYARSRTSAGQLLPFCKTLELPWMQNAPNISCIPPGVYFCSWTYSPHFGRNLYLVADVPGRSGIRIHPANFAGSVADGYKCDLLGCIALGRSLFGGPGTGSQLMVTNSRVTFDDFYKLTLQKIFRLEIVGGFN